MRKNLGCFLIVFSVFLTGCHLMLKKRVKNEEVSKCGKLIVDGGYGNPADSSSESPPVNLGVFCRISKGKFMMGSPLSESSRQSNEGGRDGRPVRVEITKDFEMMEQEVTQSQWFQVMGKNPSYFKKSGDCAKYDKVNKICSDHPVERVSWKDVQIFIKKLNALSGNRGCRGSPKDPSGCYRLPTEAEWEYAVRAGTKTAYFFGNKASGRKGFGLKGYARYEENSGRKSNRVKTRSPNPWGLYDVYGSVWEWVQDGYNDELPGGKDPIITSSSSYVIRGGCWIYSARHLRSAHRYGLLPDYRSLNIGFRLVRTL